MISDIQLYTDWGQYKKYFTCGVAVVSRADIDNEVPELVHAVEMYEAGRATDIEILLVEEIINVLETGEEKTCEDGILSGSANIVEDVDAEILPEDAEQIWREL